MKRFTNMLNRWLCRMAEGAAGSRGDYQTALYWLKRAEDYR